MLLLFRLHACMQSGTPDPYNHPSICLSVYIYLSTLAQVKTILRITVGFCIYNIQTVIPLSSMRSDAPQTDYPKTKSKTLFGGVNCFLSLKNEGKGNYTKYTLLLGFTRISVSSQK